MFCCFIIIIEPGLFSQLEELPRRNGWGIIELVWRRRWRLVVARGAPGGFAFPLFAGPVENPSDAWAATSTARASNSTSATEVSCFAQDIGALQPDFAAGPS